MLCIRQMSWRLPAVLAGTVHSPGSTLDAPGEVRAWHTLGA